MPILYYSNNLSQLINPLTENILRDDPFTPNVITVPNFNLQKWLTLELAKSRGIAANYIFKSLETAIAEAMLSSWEGLPMEPRKVEPRTAAGSSGIPNDTRPHPKVLTFEQQHCALIHILKDKILKASHPYWHSVKAYLYQDYRDGLPWSGPSQGGLYSSTRDLLDIRIFQLAGKITTLFQNYTYHRIEMISKWEKNEYSFENTRSAETEKWQSQLWRELYGDDGWFSNYNRQVSQQNSLLPENVKNISGRGLPQHPTLFLFSQLVNQFVPLKPDPLDDVPPSKLHIFGLSYISPFHRDAITKLSQQCEIMIYSFLPHIEFWEDLNSLLNEGDKPQHVLSQSEKIRREEFQSGALDLHDSEPALLREWGMPGRENIRLINESIEWELRSCFVHDKQVYPLTLLERVQFDIITRKPGDSQGMTFSPKDLEADDSLRILACPSLKRETEIIANEIWNLVKAANRNAEGSPISPRPNETILKFNEIAVIVPDMDLYQDDLEVSFNKLHQLPYNLIDGTMASVGRLCEGILALLKLGLSEYTRKDLFQIFNHPNFIAEFGHKDIDVEQWLKWSDELGIFYGINKEENEKKGNQYYQKDLYNWEQGFRRIDLGLFLQKMEGHSEENTASIYEMDVDGCPNEKYIPLALEGSQHEEVCQFMLIVRSLISDTKDMPQWKMNATQWGQYLMSLVKTYFDPLDDSEQSIFQSILNIFYELSELDQICVVGSEKDLSYRTILEFVERRLSQVTAKRGFYLADGITISSFLPMRPIPFKVVFIMGLGEGVFPRPSQSDHQDLRESPYWIGQELSEQPSVGQPSAKRYRTRNIGDVSNLEQDQYMFLESLISTKKSLYLSYVSRDSQSGEVLEPSSIIRSLIDVVESQYLPEGTKFLPQTFPLKGYDLSYFPELQIASKDSGHFTSKNYDNQAFLQARAYQLRKHLDQYIHQSSENGLLDKQNLIKVFNTTHPIQEERWLSIERGPSGRPSADIPLSDTSPIIVPIYFNQIRSFLECPLQSSAKLKLGIFDKEDEDLSVLVDEPFETDFLKENTLLKSVFVKGIEQQSTNWEKLYLEQAEWFELHGEMPTGKFKTWSRNRHIKQLRAWETNLKRCINSQVIQESQQFGNPTTSDDVPINWFNLKEQAKIFRFGPSHEGRSDEKITELFSPIVLNIPLDGTSLSEGDRCDGNITVELQGNTQWCVTGNNESWYSIYFSNYTKKLTEKHFIRPFLDMVFLRASEYEIPNSHFNGVLISASEQIYDIRSFQVMDSATCRAYLSDLVKAMLEEDYHFLMPIEAMIATCKSSIPTDPEIFNQQFQSEVHKLIESPSATCSSKRGPISDLTPYALPPDPYRLFQKRFLPYFQSQFLAPDE